MVGEYRGIELDIVSRYCPDDNEWRLTLEEADKFRIELYKVIKDDIPVDKKDVVILGSVARGTFVKGEQDIDIFLRLPVDIDMDLDSIIDIIEDRIKKVENVYRIIRRFADHPYLEVRVKDTSYNIVPSYKSKYPNWKSPVDRSFYHNRYLLGRNITSLRCDVVLLKKFLKGINVYGAEARVNGFSGYLVELLTIWYGGFKKTIEAIAKWTPPVIIDMENMYESNRDVLDVFGDSNPLIVVDPVDRGRNVAAALSFKRFSMAISAAKRYVKSPRKEFFGLIDQRWLDSVCSKLSVSVDPLIIIFRHGEKIEDIHIPQLRRIAKKLRNILQQRGFTILKMDVYSNLKSFSVIALIPYNTENPSYRVTRGPPAYHVNEDSFLKKNKSFITWIDEDGRWYSLKPNFWTNIVETIIHILKEKEIRVPNDLTVSDVKFFSEISDKGEHRIIDDRDLIHWLSRFICGEEFWKFLI